MALAISPERIQEIRVQFEDLVSAPAGVRDTRLDALERRDRVLWSQVRSLLTMQAHADTLRREWRPALTDDAAISPWETLRGLAGWLLGRPPDERARLIDALGPPLHDAVMNTLVVFQGDQQIDQGGGMEEDTPDGSEARSKHDIPGAMPEKPTGAPESVRMKETAAVAGGPMRPGQRVRQYEVLALLGEGGMGQVYEARDTRLGRIVALKVLAPHLDADANARSRFEHEARAASALDHPHVGTIHEISATEAGQPFIAMAHYAGETLHQKLERGPLPVEEALRYARQIAKGLAAAHEAGIIHRDIKPANVIVTEAGAVKILDFGLAKVHDVTLTRTTARMGTVAYMSPEQARGEAADARADLWALGALLYELVAGARPFEGAYETAVMYNLVNEPHQPLHTRRPDCPAAVEAIVDRCLQKSPAARYPSARALLADLDAAHAGRPAPGASAASASKSTASKADEGDGPRAGVGLVERALRSRAGRVAGTGVGLLLVGVLLWIAGGQALTGNAAVQPRHLAVLPFQIIGEADEADIYAAGLLETLTSKLTQLEQFQGALWVVPASEIAGPMTPTDAHERFGVTMVVSGSIQLAGEQVRLTLNLIDADTRRQLGSEQIDHRSAGALALQDEAVLMLARMLQVEIQPEQAAVLTAGGTTAPAANDFYLRGRGYLRNQESVADLNLAIGLFEKAIGRDSLFALAWAGLGEAYWLKYRATEDVQWTDRAIQASEQALALNEASAAGAASAPVYVTLGMIQAGRQRYDEAQAAFQRALEIDPMNAEAYRRRARVHRSQGLFERAEADYRKAIQLKPDYWRGYSSLGVLYYVTGRYDDAIQQFNHGLELAPANKSLLNNLGAVYWQTERVDAATRAFERILQADPGHSSAQANLATAYFYQGRYAQSAELYAAQLERTPLAADIQGFLADAYYWVPDRAKAEAAYRKAIQLTEEHLAVRGNDADLLGGLASYHARLGDPARAADYLRQVQARANPAAADVVLAFGVGEVYEHLGQREAALPWMARALRNGYGWIQIRHSPWLSAFRQDAEVQTWLAEMRRESAP